MSKKVDKGLFVPKITPILSFNNNIKNIKGI